MATIVLPDINQSTLNDLRKRFPKLSEVDLPSMEKVGKRADHQIKRLRGKPRTNPIVPCQTWPADVSEVAWTRVRGAEWSLLPIHTPTARPAASGSSGGAR